MNAIHSWHPNPVTAGGQFGLALESLDSGALLTVGGQDALRVVDGYGLAGDTNAEWRVTGIDCPAVVDGGVTNRPWVRVKVRCSMPGPWREAALWASRDFREWEETDFAPTIEGGEWTYLIPTNTGYRCFRAVGTLAPHPESRLETDFSIAAMGDVTASNGTHRLSAKADAADLAGYAPTGHVHDAADIASGTLDADRIPNLAASKITSGTLAAARIPSLAASKITSGTLAAGRIPNLDASKIASGTLDDARIPASIVRDTRLAGQTFDFSDLRGLYVAVSNLAAALGGTVTNFPSFDE